MVGHIIVHLCKQPEGQGGARAVPLAHAEHTHLRMRAWLQAWARHCMPSAAIRRPHNLPWNACDGVVHEHEPPPALWRSRRWD